MRTGPRQGLLREWRTVSCEGFRTLRLGAAGQPFARARNVAARRKKKIAKPDEKEREREEKRVKRVNVLCSMYAGKLYFHRCGNLLFPPARPPAREPGGQYSYHP